MSGILKMPRMGETMEEGKLTAWLVEAGQPFKRGDALLEVETDKTTVEFPALGDGALVEALVELGEMVDVGTPIAKIDVGDGTDWTDDGSEDKALPKEAPSADAKPEPQAELAPPHRVANTAAETARPRATPLARRIAKKNGVDLTQLMGTGRRGRIERRDVEAFISSRSVPLTEGLQTGHGLAWLEKGGAAGAPVLFIHGFAADHTAWASTQSHFARAGFRTLAVDLPSHGAASLDAHDVNELHTQLQTVAQERFGWVPAHIVAHSMGAIAAVQLAQTYPTASLTLITPAGLGRRINTEFLASLAQPKSFEHVKSTLKQLTAGPNGLSDTAIHEVYENLKKGRLEALTKTLAGTSGQVVDIRPQIAELSKEIPVSIVLGHRDQVLDWSEAINVSPLVSLHHFPDAGHMPHWEAHTEMQDVLKGKFRV